MRVCDDIARVIVFLVFLLLYGVAFMAIIAGVICVASVPYAVIGWAIVTTFTAFGGVIGVIGWWVCVGIGLSSTLVFHGICVLAIKWRRG